MNGYRKEEEVFFLSETAVGYNNAVALLKLRNAIRSSCKEEEVEKKRIIYSNKVVDDISIIVTKYLPKKSEFWKLFTRKALLDMQYYNFTSQPSVNRKSIKMSDYFIDASEDKLRCCENIDLATHTLNVIKEYDEVYINYKYTTHIDGFLIVMACLLHDYGKSIKLTVEKLGNIDKKSKFGHEYYSAIYINNLITEVQKTITKESSNIDDIFHFDMSNANLVKNAVKDHHLKVVEEGSLANILKDIDGAARKREYQNYIEKRG